jgi:hypothetical protein
MSAPDKELALTMIHRMYDRFEEMFAYWHKRQVKYLNAEKVLA